MRSAGTVPITKPAAKGGVVKLLKPANITDSKPSTSLRRAVKSGIVLALLLFTALILFSDLYSYLSSKGPVVPVVARYRSLTVSMGQVVAKTDGLAFRSVDGSELIRRWPIVNGQPQGPGVGEYTNAKGEVYTLNYATRTATLFKIQPLPLYRPRLSITPKVIINGLPCVSLKERAGTGTLYWSPRYDLFVKSKHKIVDGVEHTWEWYDIHIGMTPKPEEMRIPPNFTIHTSMSQPPRRRGDGPWPKWASQLGRRNISRYQSPGLTAAILVM